MIKFIFSSRSKKKEIASILNTLNIISDCAAKYDRLEERYRGNNVDTIGTCRHCEQKGEVSSVENTASCSFFKILI